MDDGGGNARGRMLSHLQPAAIGHHAADRREQRLRHGHRKDVDALDGHRLLFHLARLLVALDGLVEQRHIRPREQRRPDRLQHQGGPEQPERAIRQRGGATAPGGRLKWAASKSTASARSEAAASAVRMLAIRATSRPLSKCSSKYRCL